MEIGFVQSSCYCRLSSLTGFILSSKFIKFLIVNSSYMLHKLRIGVNFDGFKISDYQNRSKPLPPRDYIQDSFKIFVENKVDILRIPVYWESYEKDPNAFLQELHLISEQADKYNISCIYDNHQWECSSFLGYGIGYPNSIVSHIFQNTTLRSDPYKAPLKKDLEKFWNDWWDRMIKSSNGEDAWDLQFEFIQKVLGTVDKKESTIAIELLNEPQVFRYSDFKKVSKYHDFMVDKIAHVTDKSIIFCYSYTGSNSIINFPWLQAKIRPSYLSSIKVKKNKIMFDVHPYPPYNIVMFYFDLLKRLMKIDTMIIGEYNSGTRSGIKISQSQHQKYLKTFKKFLPYGAMFWQWSYIKDNNHDAFNLTKVIDGKIAPNDNFTNLVKSKVQENL